MLIPELVPNAGYLSKVVISKRWLLREPPVFCIKHYSPSHLPSEHSYIHFSRTSIGRLATSLHHGVSIQLLIINVLMRGEHHVEHPSYSCRICFDRCITHLALQQSMGILPQWLAEFDTHLFAYLFAHRRNVINNL